MSLDAYLYDDRLKPLSYAHIDLTETDDKGCTVDQRLTSHLGPSEFGAKLSLPSPAEPVALYVDDVHASPSYAPACLEYVNGRLPARLDVVIYPLPKLPPGGSQPSGGGGEGSSDDSDVDLPLAGKDILGAEDEGAADSIPTLFSSLDNPRWTAEERKGVVSLLHVVQSAYSYLDPGDDLKSKRRRWAAMLAELGIVVAIDRKIRRDEDESTGGMMGA